MFKNFSLVFVGVATLLFFISVLPPVMWYDVHFSVEPHKGHSTRSVWHHDTTSGKKDDGGSIQTIGATNVKGTLNIDDNNKDDFCGPNMKDIYSDRCCSHFTRVQYLAMFAFGITLVSFLIAIFNRKAQNERAQKFELFFVLASFALGLAAIFYVRFSTLWKDPFCGLPDTWFRDENKTIIYDNKTPNLTGGIIGDKIEPLNPQLVHDKTVTWYGLILFSTATGMMGIYAINQIMMMCSTPSQGQGGPANSITHKVGSLTF